MGTEAAESAESATATQTEGQESKATEGQAAAAAESATAGSETSAEAQTGEPSKETGAAGSEPVKDLGKKGVDELIHTRKRAQTAEQEAAYWRGVAEGRKGTGSGETESQPDFQPTRPAPEPEQFETQAEFVRATVAWDREQADAKATREQAVRSEGEQMAAIIKAGIKKYGDEFDKNVLQNPTLPITKDMDKAIKESEQAADILHHLGSNPDEAARISQLSPLRQAVEIGKLEVKLSTAAAPAVPVKKVPPAPPATVGGTGSTIPDESKMSDEQWHAEEKKRIAEAKRTGKR